MLTKYAVSKLVNHLLGKAAFTMPNPVYLVLFTADPTTDGLFTNEVPASRGYARASITATMSSSVAGAASANAADVTFGPCITGDWGNITHVGIADSSTLGSGNLLTYKALAAADQRIIKIGDDFRVPATTLTEAMA
tara:strand:- start:6449 stop:6859 length:411 start_codon:yes stop_codon:yes gene_type:complete